MVQITSVLVAIVQYLFEQNTEKWLDAVIETIFAILTILSEF